MNSGNPLLVSDENEYPTTGRHRSRNNHPAFGLTSFDISWQHMNGANSTAPTRLSHNNNNLAAGQTFQINSRNGLENLSTFGGQTIINSNGTFEREELAILDNSIATTNPNNGATTATAATTTSSTTVPDSITNSVWMKSMWPNHLINGMVSTATTNQQNLNQPATLIQWTILIGSLLSVILLILLILRKLFVSTFPSYQWMLAKQTLKNTSKLNQTAVANLDCCQASAAAAAIHQNRHLSLSGSSVQANSNHAMLTPCIAIASAASSTSSPASLFAGGFKSSNKHHHHIHYQQASPIPPHHMCYAWRRQQQPAQADIQGEGVIDCNNKHRLANGNNATTAHQYIVDANGKHILGSSLGAEFNTDIYDLPASFAHESANSMTNSTTTSGYKFARTNMSMNKHNMESHSETSAANYNYDTLNSNYGNQALNVQQDSKGQFQQQHITHNYLPQIQPQSSFNAQQQAQLTTVSSKHAAGQIFNNFSQDNSRLDPSQISGITNSFHQHQTTSSLNETTKHRSPKVPKSQKRFDQAKHGRDLSVDDTKSSSSSRSSLTISGNSEGGDESNSSPSIQSTTAQMLSNAASCSFEQTPDQNNDLKLTPLSCADGNHNNSNINDNNDTSMGSIPTSNGSSSISNLNSVNRRAKNGLSSAKLVCSNTVQSQPNSPIILANQLANRASHGKLSQRTGHSNASKLISSTSRLKLWNQNDGSEPDCSQLGESSDQQVVQQQSELQEQFLEQKSSTSHHGIASTVGCSDNDQAIIRSATLEGEANDNSIGDQQCDRDEDRHYYEEITTHNQAI